MNLGPPKDEALVTQPRSLTSVLLSPDNPLKREGMVSFVARFDLSHVLFIFLIFFSAHLLPTPQSRAHAYIHFGRMTFRLRFQYTFLILCQ
jgi:hypothetical protein